MTSSHTYSEAMERSRQVMALKQREARIQRMMAGSAWQTASGGGITGNNKVWRKVTFAAITTSKIRVLTNAAIDNGYSRITEVEAWGTDATSGTTSNINWLVTDQLGPPRMVFDQTGALATVKRHDYLPFGEELSGGQGVRNTTLGYGAGDGVRQKFTSQERDNETASTTCMPDILHRRRTLHRR